MKQIALTSILALGACTPIVWERPGTTQDQYTMDRARCQLTANTIEPGVLVRDVGDAVVVGLERGENFQLCMVANGYHAQLAK